ncbi:MAG: ABC transporter permease [Longimicrobiales bacterium]
MTLFVAGVGVENIMYVVVHERTQEIGVKVALGARKRHIMSQFIFEVLTISLTGGLFGLAVAAAIVLNVDGLPTSGNKAMESSRTRSCPGRSR